MRRLHNSLDTAMPVSVEAINSPNEIRPLISCHGSAAPDQDVSPVLPIGAVMRLFPLPRQKPYFGSYQTFLNSCVDK
jgi:hypothetical protein